MRILLEWILERGNGVYVGRCDLISEGVAVDILERGSVSPSAAFLDVGIGNVKVMEIGRMEVPERVEAVGRYAEIALTFPEPIGNLRRQQMRDISALFDALDYEMREQNITDTGRRFRLFSDPFTRRITDDRPTDMHEVPVYV